MRVYNLTDVPTPTLQANGLVSVSLRIGGALIEPGAFADVQRTQPADQRLFTLKAAADHEPVTYLQAKAKMSPPAPLKPEVLKDLEKVVERVEKATLKPESVEVGVEDNVMVSDVFPDAAPSPFSEPPGSLPDPPPPVVGQEPKGKKRKKGKKG